MSDKTGIAWTDATWNPVRGCSRVSAGCQNCYAERVAARFNGPGQPYEGLARWRSEVSGLQYVDRGAAGSARPTWTGVVRLVDEKLDQPLRWQRPRRIFVNSMSDLFHESLPDETIAAIFGVMAASRRHTFQILTKRPERMREWFRWIAAPKASTLCFEAADRAFIDAGIGLDKAIRWKLSNDVESTWPLPNVVLGVSVENQATADERIPILLDTPAAVRFVSYEPAIGPVDFWSARYKNPNGGMTGAVTSWPGGLDWVIVGGESGPKARPFAVEWARSTVAQCRAAGVACFVKQLGREPYVEHGCGDCDRCCARPQQRCASTVPIRLDLRSGKGDDPSEWPEELRVREFPECSP